MLLLGLVNGRLKLVDLLLKRGDFCRVLLGRVVAQGLCSMVSLLLGLLLRLSRGISLLLGSVVGLLGGLELLCRLLGKLSRRLRNRLRSRCGGIARGTTPPPRVESPPSIDGAAIAASGDKSGWAISPAVKTVATARLATPFRLIV